MCRPRLTLYTRANCHLCEEAKVLLGRVREQRPFDLECVSVDADAELADRYGLEVPVLLIGGRKRFKYRIDEDRLRRLLDAEEGR